MNLLVALIQIAGLPIAGQQTIDALNQGVSRPEAALGRVKIVDTINGKTVRASNGHLLRGGAATVFKYGRDTGQTDYIRDLRYWRAMRSKGINAVRLIFFDPWQRSHGDVGSNIPYPYADLNDPAEVNALLRDIDHVVSTAKAHGMYVMINYHDTGGYRDPDYSRPADENRRFPSLPTMDYLIRFWELVAPRYANEPHVFYELTNEPVQWLPEDYTNRAVLDFERIYEIVRRHAPDTHVALLTFANHQSQDPRRHSMLKVAQRLENAGVDFSNASVAFHPYNLNYPLQNRSQTIKELMREFPVINSEQNFPKGLIPNSEDPDAAGLDGDYLGVQSMERLGISWFHWQIDGPNDFRANFEWKLVPDAIRKKYYWQEVDDFDH